MKTINRYILWELLQSFFFALLAMTVLLIIVGLVREALDKNVPLTQIVRLVPFVMVNMAPISIPMTLLLAVTTFFAKMSGNNEVIALKSLGIPPWMFLWPVMIMGVAISLVTVYLNELAVTWGRAGIASVIYGAAEDIILNQLKSTHHFASPNGDLTIMVQGVENRRLIAPTINLKNPPTTVEAKSAQLKIDFSAQELTVDLTDFKVDVEGDARYISGNRSISMPLATIVEKEGDFKRPADMGLADIPKEIDRNHDDILKCRRIMAAHKAFAACVGSMNQWEDREIRSLRGQNRESERTIQRLNVEPPRRWATGFSCFFFIWIGAPFAIWMKKSDIFSSFFACFAPILLLYYPLLMYGMQGAKGGRLPPASVWIANVCLGIIGLWVIRRIHRY